ncbi:SpoIIE family protein phosphatase [Herpetosiphon sp. NSE202]|uniref:SpoIIE family protein phosphatase n=1 Tax=Herpetosiphon sp. NSE202 TaxID=3351349 RepID=UPI0036271A5D
MLPSFDRGIRLSKPRMVALGWAAMLFLLGCANIVWYGLPTFNSATLPVAGALLLLLDGLAVRDRSNQPLSLSGVVLLAVALISTPSTTLVLAAASGLCIRLGRLARSRYEDWARRALESGARSLGLALALPFIDDLGLWSKLCLLILSYIVVVQGARLIFALLWDGKQITLGTWQVSAPNIFSIEMLPLPLAAIGAQMAQSFPFNLVAISAAGLIGSAWMVQRASRSLGLQRRTVAELGQINAISRAIIRAELDVDSLCQLVFGEASKVVDTSNFRLGLFEGRFFELKVRVQDGHHEPPLRVEIPNDRGIVSWIRRTGRSLLVEDFETEMDRLPAQPTYQAEFPPRSGIYIPLMTGDEVLGTISIQSSEPRAFDTDDLRLLSLIADQAAVAIDKARAYSAARRRAAQLATIGEVSRQVTAILDLDRLLPSVVHRIRVSFGYSQVHLFTFDQLHQQLFFRASTASDSPFWQRQGKRLPLGLGIVGHVAVSGEPMLVNDVREEPRFLPDQPGIASELAVPMRVGQQLLGVLDVQSERYGAFDENDFFVVQTLADQIAIAIDSASVFQSQQEEAWVLNALLQSAENFAWVSEISEMLYLSVRLPALLVGCERALCLLWQRESNRWILAEGWGLTNEQRQSIGASATDEQVPWLVRMRSEGESFAAELVDLEQLSSAGLVPYTSYGAVLAQPLNSRGATLGVLLLEQCGTDETWLPRQVTIAAGIAGQAAAAIESALFAQIEAARQHIEQEISVAREIQMSLLPARLPQLEGWDSGAHWNLARQVGGDFYDFWQFRSGPSAGEMGFVIADVSDKGVPAALFMALSRSLVRGAALDGSPPSQAIERANRWIMRDSQSYMFVTLFYGIINPVTGRLRYTCAGHNPPLLYRAATGEIEQLRTPGIALGVIDDAVLGEAETTIELGDVLVCYTDGVTEAVDSTMDEWGVPRLMETIHQTAHADAATMLHAISSRLAAHTGDLPAFDDLTLVVIKRLASANQPV